MFWAPLAREDRCCFGEQGGFGYVVAVALAGDTPENKAG